MAEIQGLLIHRGIVCRQNYATADLGNVAYESEALDGMIVDEGVVLEIVTPGTGNPVPVGEVGEVVVTSLNADYPLIRFATGDLSAFMPGVSSCGIYLFCLLFVALSAVIARNLTRGAMGRKWMAIRDMDIAAEIIGVNPLTAKLSAFAISSFFVGVSGALFFSVYLGAVEVGEVFGINKSFLVLY